MKTLLSITFSFCLLLTTFSLQADTGKPLPAYPALRVLLNTSGTVYSAFPGTRVSQESNSTRVKVILTKTGGRAKADIKVSVQTQTPGLPPLTTVKKTYTFENGNYTRTKTFILYKMKGKKAHVSIDNRSFSNKFQYTLKVEEIN